MYLIIDLEATCWQKSTEHKGENETIEIGCVILNDNCEVIGEFQSFVRPIRNLVLSEFCKKLTTIEQSDVDTAPTFPEVLKSLQKQAEDVSGQDLKDATTCSWGNYDKEQLMQDCKYHKIPYPLGWHRNLKAEFAEKHEIKPVGMARALRILRIPLIGTHHRAIDDARNITKIFKQELGENK
jgi:inhibitor of KinA sporulation pathway (predicted exonuclease)